jgi:thermitase
MRLSEVGTSVGRQPTLHIHRLHLNAGVSTEQAISTLRKRPDVLYAEPVHILHVASTPNDSYFGQQWAPQKVQADLAWGIWQPKTPVVIAIIDTGVDSTHPDLASKMDRDANGILGYNAIQGVRSAALDVEGHGTHCAGIAAAQVDNGVGIAGIAGWNGVAGTTDTTYTKIMPIQALDSTGSGTDASIANGILWAVNNGAKVISLSLGSSTYSATLDSACQYALGMGCVVVAAAGNNGSSAPFYPAANSGVIAVAATDSTDTLASFSNYGSSVSVAAPGSNIYSTTPTYPNAWALNYCAASGTSMACPHVSGEAALLLAQNPSLSPSQVKNLITTNVDPYKPYSTHTLGTGVGRINVYRALLAATSSSGLPAVPTSLTATAGNAQVSLSWQASAGATSYNIKRSTTSGGPYTTVATGVTSTSYTSTGLTNGVKYFCVVSATNGAGESSNSNEAYAQPFAVISNVTLNPTSVTGGTSVQGTVTLNGAAPSGGLVVTLTSSSASATVPASVTVPANTTSATFTVTTSAVSAQTSATVTATSNSVSMTATLTLTSTTVRSTSQNLLPIADAYVQAGAAASKNFGSQTQLIDKRGSANSSNAYNRAVYLMLDLSSVTQAPSSAVLNLTVSSASNPAGSSKTVNLYSVSNTSWTESGITWNNAPGLNTTNFTSTGTFITSQAVTAKAGVASFNITAFVAAHLGQKVTLQLIDATTNNLEIIFQSREATSGQPVLALTF